ncbi:MAG: cytochrome c3 family protein, partial [Thermoanaerobaculia bacterium]
MRTRLPGRFCTQLRGAFVVALLAAAIAGQAEAQLGNLLSPGPLSKAHAKLEGLENCGKCHEKGRQVAADRCLTCHRPVAERIAQKKGVHRDAGRDCVACHVEHAGRDAELRPIDVRSFDHLAETGFPLDGLHAPLAARCAACHKTRSFLGLATSCASCHADPHKGALGNECARCHSVSSAFKSTAKSFDHSKAKFALEGAHQGVACAKCHVNQVFKGLRFDSCAACHKSPHGQKFPGSCGDCHAVSSWRVATFDHSRTGTPLVGKHRAVPCAKCHVQPASKVKLTLRPCAACHRDPHRGEFRQDCGDCHKETGFAGVPFEHGAKTKFALEGRHMPLACGACHGKGVPAQTARATTPRTMDFRGLKTECASCHADPHWGELGTRCDSCHTAKSFKVERFEHQRSPGFFTGPHATASCDKCHRATSPVPATPVSAKPVSEKKYRDLSTDCVTCHRDPHLGQMPNCAECHSIDAPKFAANAFRHERTPFALTGKHAQVACAACHKKETGQFVAGKGTAIRFRGIGSDCAACHKDVHVGQFGAKCETCHTTASFAVTTYAHRKHEEFFRGAHRTATCEGCHGRSAGSNAAGTATVVRFVIVTSDCASCHRKNYEATKAPQHMAAGFPLACEACHRNNYVSWQEGQWNHSVFPLTGVHAEQPCVACHRNGIYQGTARSCVGCHQADYNATKSPNHVNAGFPLSCESCHKFSDRSWTQATFKHPTFPLSGAHATQACATCHKNGVYQGTARSCVGCHQTQYSATKNPNHTTAGFPTACESCHKFSDTSWTQGKFSHATFPLSGTHATQVCGTCHKNGVYQGTARSCAACHQAQYSATKNPNHVTAGFPTACESCHKFSDTSWTQGKFSHATFPLSGAHASQACATCHKNGVYQGTARSCVGCHQTQYNTTKNPNHVTAGFPTACESCHKFSDTTWT